MSPNDQRDASVASANRTNPPAQQRSDTSPSAKYSAKPDYFYGDRNKVDDWINQLMMYFVLEGVQGDARKTLTASSYLRGEAQHWIRPLLHQFLVNRDDSEGMFNDWPTYMAKIRNIYGLSNEQQVAIRMIQSVTQKGSASQYTAKFKEYSTKTNWDDNALRTMYYRGLKDHVKDELMRNGRRQATFEDLAQAAIQVDDMLYERFQEKRHAGSGRGRTGYVANGWTGGQQRRDPDAMELDATHKGKAKGTKGNQAQGRSRKTIKCYNCQKIGHMARDCRGRKVQPPREVNMMTIQANEQPKEIKARGAYDISLQHAKLSWTACYDDNCRIHRSDKEGSGWFPSKRGKQQVDNNNYQKDPGCKDESDEGSQDIQQWEKEWNHGNPWNAPTQELNIMSRNDEYHPQQQSVRRQETQTRESNPRERGRSPPPLKREDANLQQPSTPPLRESLDSPEEEDQQPLTSVLEAREIQESPDPTLLLTELPDDEDALNPDTPSTSDSSGEDSEDEAAPLQFNITGPLPLYRMVQHIARRYEEAFPEIEGKRRLHPIEFDKMLEQLRQLFWNYRRVRIEPQDNTYVYDRAPIGSYFDSEGYVTPEGCTISGRMRKQANVLRRHFLEMIKIQEQHHLEVINDEEAKQLLRKCEASWKLPIHNSTDGPLPEWRQQLGGPALIRVRGRIAVQRTRHTLLIKPTDGPLNWEVYLEQQRSWYQEPKNE